jgi:YkoY family integral membrane protein
MLGLGVHDVPMVVLTIVWLVFLEGLLSADNALVMAMMVRHLPKKEQKRALRIGIWAAFIFRGIAVGMASLLLRFWFLKVLGGLYLLYLAVAHFVGRSRDEGPHAKRAGRGFWATVVAVNFADLAFSIDSILAAVALADGLPGFSHDAKFAIVITGGILGIITMRFVAGYFITLLERFQGLENGAFGLVAWIGLKLLAGGLHNAGLIGFEMNEWVFWPGMLVIVAGSFLYRPSRYAEATPEDQAVIEEVARIASGGNTDSAES